MITSLFLTSLLLCLVRVHREPHLDVFAMCFDIEGDNDEIGTDMPQETPLMVSHVRLCKKL